MPILKLLLMMWGPTLGIIVHPDGDPNLAVWVDRPPDAVVGRWGNNASCVAVAPDCVITTRHQGVSTGIGVVLDGRTYPIRRLWSHDTADLCIAQLEGANLQHTVTIHEEPNEVGSLMVVAGYGNGRGANLETLGIAYGYAYDRLANVTLRFGTNRIDSTALRTDGQEILVADFDGALRGGWTAYECIPAVYDSGGGWFIAQGDRWTLAGLSQGVEEHYQDGHEDDPEYLIPYEAWFAKRSNPLRPDPDQFAAVRIWPHIPWIRSILCQAHGGDINHDGFTDLLDFAVLAEYWSRSDCLFVEDCMGADFDSDGGIDFQDLSCFIQQWLR